MHIYFFMFILAHANPSSLQQIRPEDLFCYHAICAMALRSKFEIVRIDHTWLMKLRYQMVDESTLPDAKWWQPFSKDGGDMAFKEKRELFTSAFNPNGNGTYKYNFWRSMSANGQEVKVYQHCGGLHIIFVRQAPSLRVYVSTSQPYLGVGETTHLISLKKEASFFLPDDVVIFEKDFGNDGSDITLGQILPVARCHLIEKNHVTYAGKLDEVALSHRQNLAQGDVRTIIAELLLEDDYVIRKDDFLQGDHVRSFSDLDELGCRKVHTQRRRLAHENTVQTAAVLIQLDFLALGVHRTPEVVLACTTPIRVESGCEEQRLLLECHIPSIFREWLPPLGIW